MNVYLKIALFVLFACLSPTLIVTLLCTVRRIRVKMNTVLSELESVLQKQKEVNDLKYKTFETANVQRPVPQTFSPMKDEYILDPKTGEIEKLPIQKNVQDEIDSYLECALDRILERLLPKDNVTETDDPFEGYSVRVADLSELGSAMELAEDYRERYNLPATYSMAQIYEYVDKEAAKLKERILSSTKKEEQKADESKS